MVRFSHVSVTLSNACEIKKVCRQHYTVFITKYRFKSRLEGLLASRKDIQGLQ